MQGTLVSISLLWLLKSVDVTAVLCNCTSRSSNCNEGVCEGFVCNVLRDPKTGAVEYRCLKEPNTNAEQVQHQQDTCAGSRCCREDFCNGAIVLPTVQPIVGTVVW